MLYPFQVFFCSFFSFFSFWVPHHTCIAFVFGYSSWILLFLFRLFSLSVSALEVFIEIFLSSESLFSALLHHLPMSTLKASYSCNSGFLNKSLVLLFASFLEFPSVCLPCCLPFFSAVYWIHCCSQHINYLF